MCEIKFIFDKGSLRSDPSCVEVNRGAETAVDLAKDDTERREWATHAAATRASTKWPPNGDVPALANLSFTLGGHSAEVLATTA